MSILCFSMNFALTDYEKERTSAVTTAAYNAWVLVNDYFSWEKEWQNYQDNSSHGEIVSAVFLFMKWQCVDQTEARKLVRAEILAREQKYCEAKDELTARGNLSDNIRNWFDILDWVTAGNFAWSMTTARYLNGKDAYPGLRTAHESKRMSSYSDSLHLPISLNATRNAEAMETFKNLDNPDKPFPIPADNNKEVEKCALDVPAPLDDSSDSCRARPIDDLGTMATSSISSVLESPPGGTKLDLYADGSIPSLGFYEEVCEFKELVPYEQKSRF